MVLNISYFFNYIYKELQKIQIALQIKMLSYNYIIFIFICISL